MFFSKAFSLFVLVPFISASLALERRQVDVDLTTHCGQWDSVAAAPYRLHVNQWGKNATSEGQSCGQVTSLNQNTIAWNNSWSWLGTPDDRIKSYTSVVLQGINKQLSAIESIPVDWQWFNQFSEMQVSNVALTISTTRAPGKPNANKIMIWLANYNAKPLSHNRDDAGNAVPVATNVTLAEQNWNLYIGTNGATTVYSFLPSATSSELKSFQADANDFVKYLDNQGLDQTQYLTVVQAGVEATYGSAVFSTTSYSAVVN
ncbi:hypothetical protein V5O48_004351 [Marasmius crinis-equi]|uniref:Concanavalin A-like lectin/glucanase n=1 Tax=Marasmius crinis-equi TaxID=585013 RepID=A0ABR3FQB7_9AGAR